MKRTVIHQSVIISLFILLGIFGKTMAQSSSPESAVKGEDLQTFYIPLKSTTHIISPEPVNYMDISSRNVEGELTDKKICRIKPLPNTLRDGDQFTVTIVANSFITVYKLICSDKPTYASESFVITIDPMKAVSLNLNNQLNEGEFRNIAIQILSKKKNDKIEKSSAYNLKLWINRIFVVEDYIFLDVEMSNKSQLQFDIDETRFKLKDKKIVKATISQDIELQPEFALYSTMDGVVRRNFRNIYAFKKFTFPTDKVFTIEFTEKQISGRKITLKLPYKKLLQAETLY